MGTYPRSGSRGPSGPGYLPRSCKKVIKIWLPKAAARVFVSRPSQVRLQHDIKIETPVYLPPANGVAKVMFSVVSVCHSVHRGSHVTITHVTIMMHWISLYRAPTPWSLPSPALLPDMRPEDLPGPSQLLVTSGGRHWRPYYMHLT